MYWDSHIHTSFSGDCHAAPEDMIKTAVQKNLSGITITDHEDIDYFEDGISFALDPKPYVTAMQELTARYASEIRIGVGIELGLQPYLANRHRKLIRSYNFDFVIASSHLIHGVDPYYPEYFAGRSEAEGYREYFESILENLTVFDDFDVYGHLDYVIRYAPSRGKDFRYADYAVLIGEILKTLIRNGKGIELNTAGYAHGLSAPNPGPEILNAYKRLGGEIVTIGSDAHEPGMIGYGFDKAYRLLKECGFTQYCVFTGRAPKFIPLFEY